MAAANVSFSTQKQNEYSYGTVSNFQHTNLNLNNSLASTDILTSCSPKKFLNLYNQKSKNHGKVEDAVSKEEDDKN